MYQNSIYFSPKTKNACDIFGPKSIVYFVQILIFGPKVDNDCFDQDAILTECLDSQIRTGIVGDTWIFV